MAQGQRHAKAGNSLGGEMVSKPPRKASTNLSARFSDQGVQTLSEETHDDPHDPTEPGRRDAVGHGEHAPDGRGIAASVERAKAGDCLAHAHYSEASSRFPECRTGRRGGTYSSNSPQFGDVAHEHVRSRHVCLACAGGVNFLLSDGKVVPSGGKVRRSCAAARDPIPSR